MSVSIRWLAALLVFSGASLQAAEGPVSVEFVAPEKFTDVNIRHARSAPEDNPNLQGLRKHTEKRAARYVQDGQTLLIEFTDIDLAGDHLPNIDPSLYDVRTVTGLYPPRIKLNYSLRNAAGTVLKSGQADLRDLGFDASSPGRSSDALRYEKRMLDKWLRKEFAS